MNPKQKSPKVLCPAVQKYKGVLFLILRIFSDLIEIPKLLFKPSELGTDQLHRMTAALEDSRPVVGPSA